MLQSTKYVNSLSTFEQYIIWRYTIGSASINMFLILKKISNEANAKYWCYLFFRYWKNTNDITRNLSIPKKFSKFTKYFQDPDAFKALGEEKAIAATEKIIKLYIEALQSIILGAPPVKTGFRTYKVAGDYPGLPEGSKDYPKNVPQLPFNSTTINPHFNFGFFIKPDSTGNLFDIRIKEGARVLFIPSEFHAYPFEKEIILPFNSNFTISSSYTGELDVIDPKTHKMNVLQAPVDEIMMGPVYEIDQYRPCKTECLVKRKKFKIYLCELTAST